MEDHPPKGQAERAWAYCSHEGLGERRSSVSEVQLLQSRTLLKEGLERGHLDAPSALRQLQHGNRRPPCSSDPPARK